MGNILAHFEAWSWHFLKVLKEKDKINAFSGNHLVHFVKLVV